jgi:hypothetical protein
MKKRFTVLINPEQNLVWGSPLKSKNNSDHIIKNNKNMRTINLFRIYWVFLLLNSIVTSVSGQTAKIGTVIAELGDTVLVPLEFTGLQNVGAVSIFIVHDPASAEFIDIVNLIPEAVGTLAASTFNPVLDTFALGISWLAPGSSGVNFPNGKFLDFKMVYKGLNSGLVFYESVCEIVDWDLNVVNVSYINGGITSNSGTSLSIWNGNGNWDDEPNWSNGIPGIATKAVIQSGEVNIFSQALCNKLMVNNGANLIIKPSYFLSVIDSLNVSGNFEIQSDETGTGSFINNGEIISTGTIIAERYLTGDGAISHFLSSPVNNLVVSTLTDALVDKYDESSGNWIALNQTDNLEICHGYRIAVPATGTYSMPGIFNYGDFVVNQLSYTSGVAGGYPAGMNVIGNPYPSAISWNSGDWIKTNLDASVYTWNGAQYVSWNGEIGGFENGIIPSAQGFIVITNDLNPELTIPNNSRTHNNQPYYNEAKYVENMTKLVVTGNGYSDMAYIHFKYDATMGFDHEFDAYKIPGIDQAPQLYSFANNGNKLSINVLSNINTNDTSLNIGLIAPVDGTFTLTREDYSFSGLFELHIVDNELDSIQNITTDSVYTFHSAQGIFEDRFLLYFAKPSAVNSTNEWNIGVYESDGTVYIKLDNSYKQIKVQLFDISGHLNFNQTLYDIREEKIHLPGNLKGLFIIRILTENNVYTGKMLIR